MKKRKKDALQNLELETSDRTNDEKAEKQNDLTHPPSF